MKNVLREKRMELYPNLSAREFCIQNGLKYATYITGWEGGRAAYYTDSNYGMAVKLCKVLNLTMEELKEALSNNYKAKKEGKMETLIHTTQYEKGSSNDNCLVQWRLKEGLTQSQVSEILGASKSAYGQWEVGRYKPDSKNLKKLMDLTGLSMHQIASVYRDEASANVATAITPIEERKQEPLTFSDMPVINAEWPLNFIKQVRRNSTKETYFPIKKEYPFVDQWIADKLFDFVDNPAEKEAQHHYRFNEQQATAVKLYYREFGNNLKSVSEKMGISKSRVQQIIMKAQRKFKICIENEIIRRANEKSDAKNAYPLNFIVDKCGLPAEDWIVEEFNRQMDEKVYASKDAASYIFFKHERDAIRKIFRDGLAADPGLLGNVDDAALTFKNHLEKLKGLAGTVAEKITEAKPTKIDEPKQDPMQIKLANQTVSYLKEENVLDGSDIPANNSRNIAISKQTAKYILRTLYGTLDYNEYYKLLSEFIKGGLNL